jgi:ppGpp synthetase/RelA/SpoT-type nucleotidyltranferase
MAIDMDWFREQIRKYTDLLPSYQKYAQALESVLGSVARQICPTAIIQARAKCVSSFAEKILRKKDKYRDPVSQLTDLCGARVIMHVRDDVEALSRFIREHFEIDEANSLDSLTRLRASEFGYRSVHYVVKFKPHVFPTAKVLVSIPEALFSLKAEIQLRTISQHAWADIGHDRLYKSPFQVPDQLMRESARLAALLEAADETFSGLIEGVATYQADYGRYANRNALREEVELLQTVRLYDPRNEKLAHQIARLLICVQDWEAVIHLLKEFPDPKAADLLSCLGYSLCQQHKDNHRSPGYREGRACLEQAIRAAPRRVEAHVQLAETWIGDNPRKTLQQYAMAFDIDPTDPGALSGYVRYKIADEKSLSFLALLKPAIATAIVKCRGQVEAGVNLPWAFYRLGELGLLLGPEHELASLEAFIQAVAWSTAEFMLEEALAGVRMLEPLERDLPAVAAAKRLLLLARAARFPRDELDGDGELRELATKPDEPISRPVVIVAGGCDPAFQQQMEGYRESLRTAIATYCGTVISGGTREGISGLVGELTEIYRGRLHTIGYLPESVPSDGTATPDNRYSRLRRTTGRMGFSVLEPLQNWIDLLVSRVQPSEVKVLGINGGRIAAFEYRLAVLLGAQVSVVRDSGRAAGTLTREVESQELPGLVLLPPDRMTFQAFLARGNPSSLTPDQREILALRIHEDYRAKRAEEKNRPVAPHDPVLNPWPELAPEHKASNYEQADDYARKLAAVGKKAVPVKDREVVLQALTREEIELLAEIEHGRYVAQKLLEGWSLGPRNEQKKQRPSLIAWRELPEEEKEKDREAVRNIPWLLKEIGFEVQSL